MFTRIQWKAYTVLGVIHLGLGFAIHALFRMAQDPNNSTLTLTAIKHLWIALGGMYFGILLGVFFLLKPIWPWVKRANNLANWRMWLIQELPTILALLPVLVGAVQALKTAWEEIKTQNSKGKLDFTHLSAIIQNLAQEAETMVRTQREFEEPSRLFKNKKRGKGTTAA